LAFALLGVASLLLSWKILWELADLSLSSNSYSYILLIPFISVFVLYLERRKIFAGDRKSGALLPAILLIGGLALIGLLSSGVAKLPAEYSLSIEVGCVLLVWAAAFAFCYGSGALKAARFPFLLLVLLTPIPPTLMDKIVTSLQLGAAEATYILFQLAGVPMFRHGVEFELPVVGIEVAKECSSIHSACALFITSLLVGHLYLRSSGAKAILSFLAIPIAMLANAVRIATLWFLGTKVDIGFLYGNLHRDGGIVFGLLGFAILMACLMAFRTVEGYRHRSLAVAAQ
jgi:exosortase